MEARLVEAAREEFARNGFASATTRAIAARAGCSEALIQNYFGGKEGLLMEVLRHADPGADVAVAFFRRPACRTPEDEIREALLFIHSGMRRRAAGLRILFERVMLDPAFAERFAQLTPRKTLVQALSQRLATAWPAAPDPEGAAEMIVALGFQLGFVDPELLGRDPDTVGRYLDRYVALLAHGLGGPGA